MTSVFRKIAMISSLFTNPYSTPRPMDIRFWSNTYTNVRRRKLDIHRIFKYELLSDCIVRINIGRLKSDQGRLHGRGQGAMAPPRG